MMREIKFRGKRIDSDEWVEGFLIKTRITDNENCSCDWVYSIQVYCPQNGSYYRHENYEINAETIGQITGLKDKNGVEIYEGDITRHTRHETDGVWKFSEHFACFLMEEFDVNESHRFYFKIDEPSLEIIGNIHDKAIS